MSWLCVESEEALVALKHGPLSAPHFTRTTYTYDVKRMPVMPVDPLPAVERSIDVLPQGM